MATVVFLDADGEPLNYAQGIAQSLASAQESGGGFGGERVGCSGIGADGASGDALAVGCCHAGQSGCEDLESEGLRCVD